MTASTPLTTIAVPNIVGWKTRQRFAAAVGEVTDEFIGLTGRELVTSSSIAGRFGAVSLDLRGLSAGIYLVRLESTGYVTTSKLVVER